MEELLSEEAAETAGGYGNVGKTPTETAVTLEGSGAENGLEGATAGGGATSNTTPKEADTEGARGRDGAGKRDRERVAGLQENSADNSSGVGEE